MARAGETGRRRGTAADAMVPITMSTEELLAQILRLPRSERARVTSELLSSLEEPEDVVAQAWATELERRSREVADGSVQVVDWEEAKQDLLTELKARRAARRSS